MLDGVLFASSRGCLFATTRRDLKLAAGRAGKANRGPFGGRVKAGNEWPERRKCARAGGLYRGLFWAPTGRSILILVPVLKHQ